MARNRLIYGMILLGVGIFFICFDGYLSLYVLRVTLALPLFSLAVSLPGMLGVRLRLELPADRAAKGQELPLEILFGNRVPWIVSPRGRVDLILTNTLTGQVQRERLAFTAARRPSTLSYRLTSPACGQVRLRLTKGKITDYLGLFSFPLQTAELPEATALFLPSPVGAVLTEDVSSFPSGEGERYSQFRPGDDPAELFDFREYREGDRLTQVHWKLSQRMDELQVRELGLPVSERVFFLLEPLGSGEECDALLDVFATISGFLGERETPHRIAFAPKNHQALTYLSVERPEEARPALETLLLAGARTSPLPPPRPAEIPAGVGHLLYLCCQPQEAAVRALLEIPGAKVTVIRTRLRQPGEPPLPPGAGEITAPPGELENALSGLAV